MKKLPTVRNGGSGCYHIQGGCELTKENYMKNEELSKRISELESEMEKLKELINAEASLAKPEPSIFERCPVRSFVCGMEILGHDDTNIPFKIRYKNGVAWLEKEIVQTLADCHDWIEKYHPALEALRDNLEGYARDQGPYTTIGEIYKKAGLWANKTPIKKPWEDA